MRTVRFTIVSNETLEDERLSIEARWLIAYLLSKPDNWIIRLNDIRKKSGKGRDKVRAMLKELERAGYLIREKARAAGKFAGTAFVIHDAPKEPETADPDHDNSDRKSVAFLPQADLPAPVQPSMVPPAPVNPPLSNTEEIVRLSIEGGVVARAGGPENPPENPPEKPPERDLRTSDPPPEPDPKPPPENDLGVRGRQVCAAMGIGFDDPRWHGDVFVITRWESAGFDFELDVLPTIASICRGKREPPGSLNYFTNAIARNHQARIAAAKGLPVAKNQKYQSDHDRLVDRQNAAIAAVFQEDEE